MLKNSLEAEIEACVLVRKISQGIPCQETPSHLRPCPRRPVALSPSPIRSRYYTGLESFALSDCAELMQESASPPCNLLGLVLQTFSPPQSDDNIAALNVEECLAVSHWNHLLQHTMSTSTQAKSTQVPGKLRSMRGSAGSPAAEDVSLHPSLRETLAKFDLPACTTIRRLYELLRELDHECLRHATDIALDPAQDSTSEVESVVGLAVFLSGSLSQCGYPGTSLFQELQLRALISSLALLQHNRVHTLDPDVYDKLRLKNISARFQKIAFQLQPSSTLLDRIRHAPLTYLIQLASKYVSFIKRGDSPWPSIFGPTVDIFFSALSLVGIALLYEQ